MNKTSIVHKCSICGLSQNYQPLASMTEKYVAIECRQCRLVSAYPMPSLDELKEYYSNYHPTQETPIQLKDRSYWNFYGFSKFLIGLFDPIASKVFGAGGGMYALARKN